MRRTHLRPRIPRHASRRAHPHPRRALCGLLLLASSFASGAGGRAADAPAAALDLSAYSGKVVYVDFWASWCAPCRASFPWMNALQEELGDEGLVLVGVNTGDDPEAAARFLEQVPAEFEIVMDTDGAIARAYGVEGMPVAFVHDREGELVASHEGFNAATGERLAEELRRFVREGR